jgi:hypothetical protein
MNKSEATRLLSQAGFQLIRQNKRSEVWSKAGYDVTIDKSYHMDPNTPHRVRKAIRMTARSADKSVPLTTKMVDFMKPEKDEIMWLVCKYCDFKYQHPTDLAMHESIAHPKSKVANSEIGLFRKLLPEPEKKPETPLPVKHDAPPKQEASTPPKYNPGDTLRKLIEANNGKRVVLPPEVARKIRKQIKQMVDAGLTHRFIAEELNRQGVKSASGNPWSMRMVQKQYAALLAAKARKAARRKAEGFNTAIPVKELLPPPERLTTLQPEPPPMKKAIDLPPSIELILEDTALTDSQKLAVMKAVGAKLPPSIALMLDDNHLTDEQRMAVLRTLLK